MKERHKAEGGNREIYYEEEHTEKLVHPLGQHDHLGFEIPIVRRRNHKVTPVHCE